MRIPTLLLLLLVLFVGGAGVASVAQQPPTPDPTSVAGTLQALVDERFTATAAAQFGLTQTAVSGESLESTADALFNQALTATADSISPTPSATFTASASPTLSATPTATLPPTAIPTGLPDDVTALLDDAYTALAEGRYRPARELFTQVIEQQPGVAEGYIGRGFALMEQSLYRQALTDIQQAATLAGDDDTYTQYLLATVYHATLNYEEALAIIDTLIGQFPLVEFYILRAEIHADMDNIETAIADYTTAMSLTLDFIDISGFFIFLLEETDTFGDDWFNDAAGFYGALAVGIGNTLEGNSFDALQNFDEALRVAGQGGGLNGGGSANAPTPLRVQYEPPGVDSPFPVEWVYYHRALLHFNQNEYDLARADIDRALAIAPDFPYTQMLSTTLLGYEGDTQSAYDGLLAVANANRHNPSLLREVVSGANRITLFGSYPPELVSLYLQAIQFRRVALSPSASGEYFIPYMDEGWVYSVALEGEPGDTLRINAEETGQNYIDPLIAVVAGGETLGADDDGGDGLDSQLTITLGDEPATLLIGSYSLGEPAQLTVSIEREVGRGRFEPLLTFTPSPSPSPTTAPTRGGQSLGVPSTPTPTDISADPGTDEGPSVFLTITAIALTLNPETPTVTSTDPGTSTAISQTLDAAMSPTRTPRPTRTRAPTVTHTPVESYTPTVRPTRTRVPTATATP
ncbi:MAG: tetratricopeptide repeat protein [Anaerolineae bacterium]|nr:tetratricopeptide repeat protein [Anaerolineae bacterium]